MSRLVSPCPARVSGYGAGCIGSGGLNSLRAVELPWLGAWFRGEATGMPALGVAAACTGFAPTSIPLNTLLGQALPGCDLLAIPDLSQAVAPRAAAAQTALRIPALAGIVGLDLFHQVIALEVDGGSNLVAVTSTNGLRATIGVF
jgi:hypothetical protein